MNTYKVKRVTSEPAWQDIPSLDMTIPYQGRYDTISAKAQLAYGEECFYLHLSTVEANFRAEEMGPLDEPCKDSCLEFFFSPMDSDLRYFNVEFNFNGCVYLGLGSNVQNLVRLIPEDPMPTIFEPSIERTEDGWEIFYKVPYSFIRRFFPDFSVYSGKEMRVNFYKCADLSEPPHYLSWNEVVGEPLTFHRPDCFGKAIFE